ncbi:MAG: DUF4397 domain-containing protein [bacterium]
MFSKKFWRAPVLLLALGAFLTAGCGDDDDESPMGPGTGDGLVRVAHLSPDAPAVDVFVDGAKVLSSVPFGTFSDYLEVPAGSRRVQVRVAGQPTSTPVIDEAITLTADGYFTVAATGKVADIGAIVLPDIRTTVSNSAKLRFIHAGADAPAVDITLMDGTLLFSNIEFNESSAFITTPGNSYDLQVRLAGTQTVVLSFGGVPLMNGTVYSVFATGLLSDKSLRATVAVDAPGDGSTTVSLTPASASVRVAHLSPDAPAVDVSIDGTPVAALTAVPFSAVSSYLTLSASTHRVQVFATGTTTNPVIDATLTLLPGVAYTVAATGLLGGSDLQPLVLVDDRTGATNGNAKVRFVHTSPDAPPVDIVVAAGSTLFPDASFRESAGYASTPAGTYDLEARLTTGGALALSIPDVALAAGENYTAFAIGLAGDATLAALLVQDTP